MKLKDVAKLCASTGIIQLSEVEGRQWIGNGYASYPVHGLPELGTDTVAAVLDFDENKQEKMQIAQMGLADLFDLDDMRAGEKSLTDVILRFVRKGRTIDAWTTEDGEVVFTDAALTKPYLADDNKAQLYLRRTKRGQSYIVGKSGMFVSALLMTYCFDQEAATELETAFADPMLVMRDMKNGAMLFDCDTDNEEVPGDV